MFIRRPYRFPALLVPLALLVGFLAGCSNDNNSTKPGDTTPPARIVTLATGTVTSNSVFLHWTAPGNDNMSGTANRYDIRYFTRTITAANFDSATAVTGEPTPTAAGTSQSFTVTGLAANTTYYFAIKAADAVPNWSEVSNVVSATTLASTDVTPPDSVTNLAVRRVTPTSVTLAWTAPGNNHSTGRAHEYEIRYSTSVITPTNFEQAQVVTNPPVPGTAGSIDSVTVAGLSPHTTYYFALRTADEVPNWSAVSNIVSATTLTSGGSSPPSAITNLAATAADSTTVNLTWTAPSDSSSGQAASYDIRYSTSNITSANWASAVPVTGEPTPGAAGTTEHMIVGGLHGGRDYYFAIRSSDGSGNVSDLSNVALVHTPSPTPIGPPGLESPNFPTTICIANQPNVPVEVKGLVQAGLSFLPFLTSANTFFLGLEGANWVANGDCWNYNHSDSGCAGAYQACRNQNEYTYTLTVNGNCGGQNYSDFVIYRAVADQVLRRGTFYLYDPNTQGPALAWIWTWAEDMNSGHYDLYQGDPSTTPVVYSLDWSKSSDNNTYDVTFIQPDSQKWVTHLVQNPCSGTSTMYDWDSTGATWWKSSEIVWNADGTGFYDTFDQSGTRTGHQTW